MAGKRQKQCTQEAKTVKGAAEVASAPMAFTVDEVNFYAMFMAIFDSIRMLTEDDADIKDEQVRALKGEFLSFYNKLKAAAKETDGGKKEVSLGKDALGNEWFINEELFGDTKTEADFVLSFFLVWLTRKCCFGAENSLLAKARQRIATLECKLVNMEFQTRKTGTASGRKIKELTEALETANKEVAHQKGIAKMVRGQSRLQSKRARRVAVRR